MAESYSIDSGGASCTAATAKTLSELSAPSTQSARHIDLTIGCNATSAGDLKVELIQATTGTGTAYTPKKVNGDAQMRVANCTAKINDTVEPSSVTVLRTWDFALPLGGFEVQLPLGRERVVPPSTMHGVRVTSSVTATVYVYDEFEE